MKKLIIIGCLIFLPGITFAAANVLIGQNYILNLTQKNDDPTFSLGGKIIVDGINGSIISLGSKIIVPGTVDGFIVAINSTVEISGTVAQDVIIIGGSLNLIGSGKINGRLNIIGARLEKSQTSIIGKGILLSPFQLIITITSSLQQKAIQFSSWLILALLSVFFFEKQTDRISRLIATQLGKSFIWGIATLLITALLSLILIFSLIGMPLLIFIPLIISISIIMGVISFALFLGKKILILFKIEHLTNIRAALLGIILIILASWIPFFGTIFVLLISIIGLGAVIKSHFGTLKMVSQYE